MIKMVNVPYPIAKIANLITANVAISVKCQNIVKDRHSPNHDFAYLKHINSSDYHSYTGSPFIYIVLIN